MGDYRAIATITATLRSMLQDLAQVVVPGAVVQVGPPSPTAVDPSRPTVRIFLYAIAPSPHLRNFSQPYRRSDGSLENVPTLPLRLHYLLSFFGDEGQLSQHLLLGAIATLLESQPVLLSRDLAGVEQASAGQGVNLLGALPEEELDQVRFVLEPLTHEELTRLWTIFSQVPYALSVAYTASIVLLRPSLQQAPTLPILQPHLMVSAAPAPSLDSIEPETLDPSAPRAVRLRGPGLGQPDAVARFGGRETKARTLDRDSLLAEVPAGTPAGLCFVSVAMPAGSPSPRNSVVLRLPPRIAGPIRIDRRAGPNGAQIRATVDVEPPCASGQRPALLLNDAANPGASAFRIEGPWLQGDADELQFDLRRVPIGRYLARIELGEVSSRLDADTDSQSPTYQRFTGPLLEVA